MPRWSVLSKAVSHCGAGCTLGDIGGEWLVAALGLTSPARGCLWICPWTSVGLGARHRIPILHDRPDAEHGKLDGVWAAVKADTLSIVAFQVGLFGGMAIYQELIFPPGLPKDEATYWMMMQLAMILGFFTALPVNGWLIRKGLKERM